MFEVTKYNTGDLYRRGVEYDKKLFNDPIRVKNHCIKGVVPNYAYFENFIGKSPILYKDFLNSLDPNNLPKENMNTLNCSHCRKNGFGDYVGYMGSWSESEDFYCVDCAKKLTEEILSKII